MKQFRVDVDFRVTKCIFVDAETAEQAEEIVEQRCKDNPYQYTNNPDACTDYSICDVNECEDEPDEGWDDLRDALAYVREQLGPDKVAVVKAQVNVCYEERRPIETDYDDEVHDLLEEWGEDNDYGEEWWSPHCEFCDIIVKV